jgi:cytoskeletal protein RodZ
LRLKEAREAKKMSLATLSEKTKIDKKYLEALEACEFDKLPSGSIYHKNFIKKYLSALDIDSADCVNQFVQDEMEHVEPPTRVHPLINIKKIWLSSVPSYVNFTIIFLCVLALVWYIASQVRNIIQPPYLLISSPQNGVVVGEPNVFIQGETEPGITILLNGTEIKNNDQGQFSETIDLQPGLNTITITAQKKHGKQTTETRYVVRKEAGQ